MDSQTTIHSLAKLAGTATGGADDADDLQTKSIESSLNSLLKKNTGLTKQLEMALLKISRLKKQRSALLDVIVKVDREDEADEYDDDDDDDSDLSAGDIDSDVGSLEEFNEGKYQDEIEEIPIEAVVKRRRITTQPKRQRIMKPIEIKKDQDGNYIFPVEIGRTKLLSLGEIIPDENFFNQNYIFPVGYSMQRTYKSMVNEDQFTVYTCSIDKDENNKPLFCIEAADAPDIVIQKNTPTAAWSEVLRRSNILRKKEFKNTVSGPEYYGLSFATIKKMIQELPGAEECLGYQWVDL